MLPFLKKAQGTATGIIIKTRKPDEKAEGGEVEDNSAAIESCAAELIRAVHAHDVKAVADAIEDAFEILDSMPHVEGEHIESNDYDSQNIKAAKGEE